MRVREAELQWATLALIAIVSMGVATDVSAARIVRLDQGDNFRSIGSIWETTPITPSSVPTLVDMAAFPVFPDDDSDPADIIDYPDDGLGFAVDFGTGLQTQLNIFQEGYVSFGATPVSPGVDSSGQLLANVVAPFYLNSGVVPSDMQYAKGLIDLGSGPEYSIDDAVKAFRVTWTVDFFPFQVVFLDMSGLAGGVAGDFDMEFNYQDFGGVEAPAGALRTSGFLLGTNSLLFEGPFAADGVTQLFSFRGGVLQTSSPPPTTVPEPNSLTLLLAGLVLLAAAAMRRRRLAPQIAR
jgi:PEP-CTERM motif